MQKSGKQMESNKNVIDSDISLASTKHKHSQLQINFQ